MAETVRWSRLGPSPTCLSMKKKKKNLKKKKKNKKKNVLSLHYSSHHSLPKYKISGCGSALTYIYIYILNGKKKYFPPELFFAHARPLLGT